MRVLIVGGAGFIGSHLTRRIRADGHRVDLLLRLASNASRVADLLPAVRLHRLSLEDEPALRHCLHTVRPTHIVHLAADTGSRQVVGLDQAALSAAMVGEMLGLLRAISDMPVPPRLFIRTGSMAEYGAGAVPFREDQREQPETGYAAAITACTHFAEAIAPTLPFPIVTARLALVYGPAQRRDFLVPSLIESCLARQPMRLQRPLDRRDLIHVNDVAELLYRLARRPDPRSLTLNIGSGVDIGVGELADLVAGLTGADRALFDRAEQRDRPRVFCLAIERMRSVLGSDPAIPLTDGLLSLVRQMRRVEVTQAA